jgi:hypothetical protein
MTWRNLVEKFLSLLRDPVDDLDRLVEKRKEQYIPHYTYDGKTPEEELEDFYEVYFDPKPLPPKKSYKMLLVDPEHYKKLNNELQGYRDRMFQVYAAFAVFEKEEMKEKTPKEEWEYIKSKLHEFGDDMIDMMDRLNWKEISEKFPKVWKELLKILDPWGMVVHKTGGSVTDKDIYKFLDGHEVYVNIHKNFYGIEFRWNVFQKTDFNAYSSNTDGECSSRPEATKEAFLKGFELLEAKL